MSRRTTVLLIVALVWCGGVVATVAWATANANEPGRAAAAPERLPEDHGLPVASDRGALLVFLHPLCPCSRATVSVLDTVLADTAAHPLDVVVISVAADGLPERETAESVVDLAARLPRARVIDRDGVAVARRFGVETSGQVLFYDATGALRFRGGVTPGRGHGGDSAPRRALIAAIIGDSGALTQVFGCDLLGPARND